MNFRPSNSTHSVDLLARDLSDLIRADPIRVDLGRADSARVNRTQEPNTRAVSESANTDVPTPIKREVISIRGCNNLSGLTLSSRMYDQPFETY